MNAHQELFSAGAIVELLRVSGHPQVALNRVRAAAKGLGLRDATGRWRTLFTRAEVEGPIQRILAGEETVFAPLPPTADGAAEDAGEPERMRRANDTTPRRRKR